MSQASTTAAPVSREQRAITKLATEILIHNPLPPSKARSRKARRQQAEFAADAAEYIAKQVHAYIAKVKAETGRVPDPDNDASVEAAIDHVAAEVADVLTILPAEASP